MNTPSKWHWSLNYYWEDILNDVLIYLASQVSSLTNITRIANAISTLSTLKKENITHEMIDNYVKHIKNAMLIS